MDASSVTRQDNLNPTTAAGRGAHEAELPEQIKVIVYTRKH